MGYNEDIQSLGLVSGLGQGFIKGWQDSDEQKMRKMEMDAKLNSQAEDRKRQAYMDAVTLRKGGFKIPDGPVDYSQPPQLDPAKTKGEAILSGAEKHVIPSFDDQGNITEAHLDPAYAALMRGKQTVAIEGQQDRTDRKEHENVLRRVAGNSQIKQRLTQYQNLDNALGSINQSENLTPQQIMEFQQAVRSNLGIKGGSGVGERNETYFKTLGLNAANMQQFLTGDPATISKDSKLMQHFKNLATIEQGNIRRQFDQSLKAASGGHASMYGRRPDLKGDLEDYLSGVGGQMQTGQASAPGPEAQAAPKGMVQPGLLSKLGGMLGVTSDAAQSGGGHPQDSAAVEWAQANPKDPRSAAILKANGM